MSDRDEAVHLDPGAVAALRSVRPIGMFFAVDFDASDPAFLSVRMLQRDAVAVRRRIAVARQALASSASCAPDDIAIRVAASIDLVGVAARVLSPALAASIVAGVAPLLRADDLWLRPGGHPAALTAVSARHVSVDTAAEALYAGVIDTVIAPLVALYRTAFGVSSRVLWGNVASALNGAVLVLTASGSTQRVPADQVVTALLSIGELTGTARALAPHFRRNSCCLYYRVPGGGICGDCVLAS